MASKDTSARILIPYQAPIRPSSLAGVLKWIEQHDIEFERYRRFNSQMLAEAGANTGGGSSGGSPTDFQQPWFAHFHFPNPLSGMVLLGRPNATPWRLVIEDEDANHADPAQDNLLIKLESAAVVQQGDIRFSGTGSGPILHGRFREAKYRMWVADEDVGPPANPTIGFELVSDIDINSGDFVFGGSWFSFINKGRTHNHRVEWFVSNAEGHLANDALLSVEKFIE